MIISENTDTDTFLEKIEIELTGMILMCYKLRKIHLIYIMKMKLRNKYVLQLTFPYA